jgi:hypothetical protein
MLNASGWLEGDCDIADPPPPDRRWRGVARNGPSRSPRRRATSSSDRQPPRVAPATPQQSNSQWLGNASWRPGVEDLPASPRAPLRANAPGAHAAPRPSRFDLWEPKQARLSHPPVNSTADAATLFDGTLRSRSMGHVGRRRGMTSGHGVSADSPGGIKKVQWQSRTPLVRNLCEAPSNRRGTGRPVMLRSCRPC